MVLCEVACIASSTWDYGGAITWGRRDNDSTEPADAVHEGAIVPGGNSNEASEPEYCCHRIDDKRCGPGEDAAVEKAVAQCEEGQGETESPDAVEEQEVEL
ncbi:MAG: hypothetical protein Q9213_001036 [Squamulea squamosa]